MTTLAEWETEYDAAVAAEKAAYQKLQDAEAAYAAKQAECAANYTVECVRELSVLGNTLAHARTAYYDAQKVVKALEASKPTNGTAPPPTPTPTPTPTPGVPPPVDLGGYTPSGLALAWRELIGVFKDEVPAAGDYVRSVGQDLWTRLR